jgi:hypothetical protein
LWYLLTAIHTHIHTQIEREGREGEPLLTRAPRPLIYIVLADAATKGKATLLKNTDDAFAVGAFGLPWFVCTNAKGETEGFWGVDHFGQVARFLDLPNPGNTPGWKSVL